MNARKIWMARKLRNLAFFLVLSSVGQFTTGIAKADLAEMTTDFLEGEVQIIDFNYRVTRFILVENGAVVDVRNDIHIRLVDNPYNLPNKFPIIAPMTAVEIVKGQIPPTYIRKYPLKHYLSLREKYEKHAPKTQSVPSSERIINKQDADYIFSLNKAGWERYVQRMIHPEGWKVRFGHHDTGTSVMAFDPTTGMGLSVQPLYNNDESPPTLLIVGSYYPLGSLPAFTDDFKKSLEKDATEDLGATYSVSASYLKMPSFEAIELMIKKK
jgi:hypothetical protein